MKFDNKKIYTSANADKLKVGSTIFVANTLRCLKDCVEKNIYETETLEKILTEDCLKRFVCKNKGSKSWALAYLIKSPNDDFDREKFLNYLCQDVCDDTLLDFYETCEKFKLDPPSVFLNIIKNWILEYQQLKINNEASCNNYLS